MNDLVTWLRAQLDDDERVASGSLGGGQPWRFDGDHQVLFGHVVIADDHYQGYPRNGEHIARWDPARVLAEVEAKRRILDEMVPKIDEMDSTIESEWGLGMGPIGESDLLIKLLAQPYAGRDGWQEEWRAEQP